MAKLTHELLERYVDGELRPHRARQVERLLDDSPEFQSSLDEIVQLGDLLRMADEEQLKDVSFEGFRTQVERDIRAASTPPGLAERLKVWASEFFDNRRAIWVPAVATIGAVALVVAFLPVGPHQSATLSSGPNMTTQPIQLHTSASPLLSRIDSVDFGDFSGRQYSIDDDRGGKVGVVWINEVP